MVIEVFESTSLAGLKDLVNKFVIDKDKEWVDKYEKSFSYKLRFEVVQSHKIANTYFIPHFVAVIDY